MGYKKDNPNIFTKEDFAVISDQEIYDVVTREGKPMLARTLQISTDTLSKWIKKRGVKIPVIRNANYYNARKPLEEQGEWETVLCEGILRKMEEARSVRLKSLSEGIEERICPTCGKSFTAKKDSTQKYCSQECVNYRIRSDEERESMSKARIGKSSWNAGRKMSAEEKEQMIINIKKGWTEEKRELQSQQQKKIWSNPELLEKHSGIMTKVLSNDETRSKIAQSVHEYNLTITDEEWKERYIKAFTTRSENGTLYSSKGEEEIVEFIRSLGFDTKKHIIGNGHNRFEIDIYVEEKRLGIEYNGVYYHSTNGINHRNKTYHFNKSNVAYSSGIELIQIWEDQWKNQQEIIKDIIAARLGIIRGEKLYARKCEIREVDTATYRQFCMANHVQGYRSASVKLGLYYKNQLVQIASFNKARQYSISTANQYEWEWIRGCISSNNKVIGGTSKLFNHFINTYNPENVLCYSDWNLFSGKGYEESGFVFEGFTGPDKFYITTNNRLQRINRNPYAYSMYKQMVEEGKLFECYGCGSKKFVWYKEN